VGSGIIYAVLIGLWAAYFIPRWLRRHEELSASRSVEKFDHAMRILSRREPTPDKRYVVMPPKPEPAPSSLPNRTRIPAQRSAPVGRPRIGAAAMRRRRILAALVLVTVLTAVLAPFTPVPWWAPVLLLVLTVADLVHLRVQVRRSREVTRTRQAVRRSVRSRIMRFDALDRLMVGRTTFLIAHRLSTLQRADGILVLDNGRLVDQGTQEELLRKNGIYKQLYEAQIGSIRQRGYLKLDAAPAVV